MSVRKGETIMARKILFVIALLLTFVCLLASCGTHTHEYGEWQTIDEATCTEDGTRERYCSCGEKQITPLSKMGHSYGEWVTTKSATCTEDGLKSRACSLCGAKEDMLISSIYGHTVVIDAAVPSTCITPGLTEGRHCSVCEQVLTKQEIVSMLPHTEEVDLAVAPTCDKAGLTEGKHCSVCKTVLAPQTEVEKTPHTYDNIYDADCNVCGFVRPDAECAHTEVKTLAALDATCTETGLTEGKICKKCEKVLVEQQVVPMKPHTVAIDPAIAATCTETGLTEGTHCSICQTVIIEQMVVPMIPHTAVTIPGTAATCTKTGLTDGKKCSVCPTVLVEQTVIPMLPHTEVIVPGTAATCTKTGLTDGKKCSACQTVLVEQTLITPLGHIFTDEYDGDCNREGCNFERVPKCKHSEVTVYPEQSATCTKPGLSAGKICNTCGEVLVERIELPIINHSIVTDKAVPATCTSTGLTEGSHCSVCGTIILEQTVIPMLPHTEVTVPGTAATCTKTGLTDGKKCLACETIILEQTVIPMLPHTEVIIPGTAATCTKTGLTDGKKCSVCETITLEQTVIPMLPHTEVNVPGTAATCTKTGLTDGKKCSVCETVLVEQKVIPMLPHTEVIDKAIAATCTSTGLTEGKHCYVCKNILVAQEVITRIEHSMIKTNAKEPTCTTDGNIDYYQCEICNKYYVDINGINEITLVYTVKKAHGHSMQYHAEKSATCTTDGNLAYWNCLICNKYYNDFNGKAELEYSNVITKALGHKPSTEWSTDDDYHWYDAECGHTVVFDKAVHTFDNNQCKCGYIKLQTPVIMTIDNNDVIHWRPVNNADTYTVIVNDNYVSKPIKGTECSLSDVKFDGKPIDKHGYVNVKILANGYVNGENKYKDSDYSSIYSSYYYIPTSSIDKELVDDMRSNYIGYGYNFVENGKLYGDNISIKPVLDLAKLNAIAQLTTRPRNQENDNFFEYYSYSSMDELSSKTEISAKLNAELGYMSLANVKMQLDVFGSEHFTRYDYNERFVVEALTYMYEKYMSDLDIDDDDDLELLSHCVSNDFKDYILHNEDDDLLIAELYEKYGTHVILGVISGGSYLAQYSISTNDESLASTIKQHFNASGTANILSALKVDIGIDLTSNSDNTWHNSTTEAKFNIKWAGSTGGLTTSPEGLDEALSTWQERINPVPLKISNKNGAIALASILDTIKPGLGAKYREYIDERSNKIYEELYDKYDKKVDRIVGTPFIQDGKNVIIIDLNEYQSVGSMEKAYDPNFLDGILNIYPVMRGAKIDRIVIIGKFDNYATLIDSFSISLSNTWNRDVEIEINNLGVVCASNDLVDIPDDVKRKYTITLTYKGVNAIKKTNGEIEFHSSINDGENYDFILSPNENEKLDFTTAEITTVLRLPIVSKVDYDFDGWYDGNGTPVTDKRGFVLDSYKNSGLISSNQKLQARWTANEYRLSNDGTYYILIGIGDNTDTDVVIPSEYNGKPVKSIGGSAFKNNKNLTNIIISDSITSIGQSAFSGCTSLKSIVIPNKVTSLGAKAFYGCTTLKSITIGNGLRTIDYETFYNCISLESVIMSDNVNSIESYAFYGCTSLKNVVMSSRIESIAEGAFFNCTALTSIAIPNGVTNIGQDAFNGCSSLTNIVIPNRVMIIEQRVFARCISLKTVLIPSSVIFIDNSAFENCTSLDTVYYTGSEKEWDKIEIGSNNSYLLVANKRFS